MNLSRWWRRVPLAVAARQRPTRRYVPGDAWQDAQGMFMAAVAASPAWNLLGAKGLGTTTFPPMGTLIDSGDVAFRQHEYGLRACQTGLPLFHRVCR